MISYSHHLISVASLEILFEVSPLNILSTVITVFFPFSLTLYNYEKCYEVFNF